MIWIWVLRSVEHGQTSSHKIDIFLMVIYHPLKGADCNSDPARFLPPLVDMELKCSEGQSAFLSNVIMLQELYFLEYSF